MPLVNFFFAHKVLKGSSEVRKAQAFLGAQSQKSLSGERFLEKAKRSILQIVVEINQNISTRYQVHFGKDGICYQAVIRENDLPPEAFVQRGPAIGSLIIV